MHYKCICLKSIGWRLIATTTTVLISWGFTSSTEDVMKIGAVDSVFKFLIYFLYERACVPLQNPHEHEPDDEELGSYKELA
jgi:uncharacterized membrane protein